MIGFFFFTPCLNFLCGSEEHYCFIFGGSLFFFRILNKLTPDKFNKLSRELLNVGIDTKYILKGVILLVRTVEKRVNYPKCKNIIFTTSF